MLRVSMKILTFLLLLPISSFAATSWDISVADYPSDLPPKESSQNMQEFLRLEAPDGNREVADSQWSCGWGWRFNGEKMPTSAVDFESRVEGTWVHPKKIDSGDMLVDGYPAYYVEFEGLQPNPNYAPQYHSFQRLAVVILSDNELVRIDVTTTYGRATDDSNREELRRMISEFYRTVRIRQNQRDKSVDDSDSDSSSDSDIEQSTPEATPSRSRTDASRSSSDRPKSGSTSRTPDREDGPVKLAGCCEGLGLIIGFTVVLSFSTGRRRKSS